MRTSHIILLELLILIAIFVVPLVDDKENKTIPVAKDSSIQQFDTINVTVSTYNSDTAQCDSFPDITANMSIIKEHKIMSRRWCAASRDLFKYLNFKDTIQIIGTDYDGYYVVMDVMGKRKENSIDILLPNGQSHGKWKGKLIWKK